MAEGGAGQFLKLFTVLELSSAVLSPIAVAAAAASSLVVVVDAQLQLLLL